MKRRDSLRHLHGTGRVSAMRNKFPHPRSEKRAHIWDVVRNVTKVSRKKPVKKKGIPQALPSMTKSPSLEILRQRKRSSSRDRALSGSSDEFLVPPKSPPRTPRRRGSVLKLMLKSHVKQALSRRSIVTSLRQDDEDEYRHLDARKVVKSVLTSSPTSKSYRSNSLDDLHKRGHVSAALRRGEFLKSFRDNDDGNRRGSIDSLHGKGHVRNALNNESYLNDSNKFNLQRQKSHENLHGRGHVRQMVSRRSMELMTSPPMPPSSPQPLMDTEIMIREQLTKNLTLELRNAIQSQDLMLTRLVLNRVRSECSEDDQHRGDLADAIRDAETQIRTFKTNESHREAMEALRTSLEIRDMKTLRMALRDVKTTQNEEELELVRKATAALEVYNSRRRASNLASELQDAIRCSDLKLTQLVLKRVREECTTKEQNEGSLVVAIEDAENLMRTLKSNETTRAVISMLRSALKSQDITMLGLALRRARKECTEEDQHQGLLAETVEDAEKQLRMYKTNERNKEMTTILRNAIEKNDMKLLELALNKARTACTEEDQNRGELGKVMKDALKQFRTFKSNETHRLALEALRTGLEIGSMKTLRMGLKDVNETTAMNDEEVELVRKSKVELEIYDSKRRASYFASELHHAISRQDMETTQLILRRVQDDCTKHQQSQGSLAIAIRDAKAQIRMYKTDEAVRHLKSCIEREDRPSLKLALEHVPRIMKENEESENKVLSRVVEEAENLVNRLETEDRVTRLIQDMEIAIANEDVARLEFLLESCRNEDISNDDETIVRARKFMISRDHDTILHALRSHVLERDCDNIRDLVHRARRVGIAKNSNTIVSACEVLSEENALSSLLDSLDDCVKRKERNRTEQLVAKLKRIPPTRNTKERVERTIREAQLLLRSQSPEMSETEMKQAQEMLLSEREKLLESLRTFIARRDRDGIERVLMALSAVKQRNGSVTSTKARRRNTIVEAEKYLDVLKHRELLLDLETKLNDESGDEAHLRSVKELYVKALEHDESFADHHVLRKAKSLLERKKLFDDMIQHLREAIVSRDLKSIQAALRGVEMERNASTWNDASCLETIEKAREMIAELRMVESSNPFLLERRKLLNDLREAIASRDLRGIQAALRRVEMSSSDDASCLETIEKAREVIAESMMSSECPSVEKNEDTTKELPFNRDLLVELSEAQNIVEEARDLLMDVQKEIRTPHSLDTLTGVPMPSKTAASIRSKKETSSSSSSSSSPKNKFIIYVRDDSKTLETLTSKETQTERILREDSVKKGTLTISREMEHLWLHFAHYSHTFVPRDLDHLSGVAAQSFVRDLCQVMKRERGGNLTQKYRCKEIDRASIKILLYAICRRGKNVSIMFGDFLRLIYCFSTPCRNNLARCGTCILNSLRENVRIDQLVFRHVNNSDISVFKPHERCVLKQFRDFVKRFVLYKIPKYSRMHLVFRGNHHGSIDRLFRGHYDEMLSKQTLDSIRKLFLSFTIVDLHNATTQTGGHHVDANFMRKTRQQSHVVPFFEGGGVVSRIYWPQFYLICEHLRLNTILHVRKIAQAFFDSATPEIERVDPSFYDDHYDGRTKLVALNKFKDEAAKHISVKYYS
eukprot:g2710.t1